MFRIGYLIVIIIFLIFVYGKSTEKLYIISFSQNSFPSREYKIDDKTIIWADDGIYVVNSNNNKPTSRCDNSINYIINKPTKISEVGFNDGMSLSISELKPASIRMNDHISYQGNTNTLTQIRLKFKKDLKHSFKEINAKDIYYDNDRNISLYNNPDFGYYYDCVLTNKLIDNSIILYRNKILYLNLVNLRQSPVQRFCKIISDPLSSSIYEFRLKMPDLIDYEMGQINLISKNGLKKRLTKSKDGFFSCVRFDNPAKCDISDINGNKIVLYNISTNCSYAFV